MPERPDPAKVIAEALTADALREAERVGYCRGRDNERAVREAAQPDTTREAVEALPRWIAVEQVARYQANVNAPGPVMHAAVLLDDVLDLLAAPSHRGDEGGKNPGDGPDHEPSPGAAARPVPAPDNPPENPYPAADGFPEQVPMERVWDEGFAAGRAADQHLRDAVREFLDGTHEGNGRFSRLRSALTESEQGASAALAAAVDHAEKEER